MVARPSAVTENKLHWFSTKPERDLPPGEIHLWLINLSDLPDTIYNAVLTDGDRVRSKRIKDSGKRALYLGGRAGLRMLAGHYVGVSGSELEFGYGDRGKPQLNRLLDQGQLKFNYTVSRNHAFYAFAWNIELGVDLEMFPRSIMQSSMARRILSPEEKQWWDAIPEPDRNDAMLQCWTRKEAYIKAIGEGLSEPLDNFCVTLWPTKPCHFLHIGGSEEEATRWSLDHFVSAPNSVGAVALRSTEYRVTGTFLWPD